jgi:hypothetical protein
VKRLRDDLRGTDADAAHAALIAVYGPRILLRPDATRKCLIAEICPSAAVLVKASGASPGRSLTNSGGADISVP